MAANRIDNISASNLCFQPETLISWRITMLKQPYARRASSVILLVLGAVVMLFAPETWAGALLLILGVAIELIGIALERRIK
jgi:hypothetical protein